jgi:hypothetical protein
MALRAQLLLALAIAMLAAVGADSAAAVTPKPQLLVSVGASGGLCPAHVCRWSARITTTTISAEGRQSRRLTLVERRSLTAAIAQLRPASLQPFAGTCPIAYDGQELTYRFRGKSALRSCTYDLRRVRAVVLVNRLLASLPSR